MVVWDRRQAYEENVPAPEQAVSNKMRSSGLRQRHRHKIEAGADMFLMPSRYGTCERTRSTGLKYGTVPSPSTFGL